MKALPVVLVAASLSVMAVSGCRVTDHGKSGNVDISTPFGGMQVKTDNNDALMTGLSIYPGATPSKDNGSGHDSANVNFSFGEFHLGVKAASYQTSDPLAKVIDFYRKDMAKYGDVIECKGDQPVGIPTHTSQGLTCDEKDKNEIHTDVADHKHDIELRAGSKHMQRIVGVEQKDGGTRIGLVYLSLPHDSDSNGTGSE